MGAGRSPGRFRDPASGPLGHPRTLTLRFDAESDDAVLEPVGDGPPDRPIGQLGHLDLAAEDGGGAPVADRGEREVLELLPVRAAGERHLVELHRNARRTQRLGVHVPEDVRVLTTEDILALVRRLVEAGIPVQGIDPAPGPAAAATKIGVPTICDFFTLARRAAFRISSSVADHFRWPRVSTSLNPGITPPDSNTF